MDGLMKRSVWLFIIVGVLLLLVGAALYSACAGLSHSASSSPYGSWSSRDGSTADLLIVGIAGALSGWIAVLLITRYHHRHSRIDCPFCRHRIHVDDRACDHCGGRFA